MITTASAMTQRPSVTGARVCSRHSCARLDPVAIPSLAERYCTTMAIALAETTVHSSRYRKLLPALVLMAMFPGSTNATAATNAGPSSPSTPHRAT